MIMNVTTDEEENALELQFGDINFDEVETLTNDEMYFLLLERHDAGITNELFEQTFNYVEKVATTKTRADIETLTMELSEKLRNMKLKTIPDPPYYGKELALHKFETVCLANFIRDEDSTVEEIRSLLPSLYRFPIDQIEIVINIIVEAKERAGGGI